LSLPSHFSSLLITSPLTIILVLGYKGCNTQGTEVDQSHLPHLLLLLSVFESTACHQAFPTSTSSLLYMREPLLVTTTWTSSIRHLVQSSNSPQAFKLTQRFSLSLPRAQESHRHVSLKAVSKNLSQTAPIETERRSEAILREVMNVHCERLLFLSSSSSSRPSYSYESEASTRTRPDLTTTMLPTPSKNFASGCCQRLLTFLGMYVLSEAPEIVEYRRE
jgi:hypothetical protein